MKQLEKIVDEEIWENEAGGSREKMKCKLSTQHTMYFLNSNAGIKTLVRKKNVLPTSRQQLLSRIFKIRMCLALSAHHEEEAACNRCPCRENPAFDAISNHVLAGILDPPAGKSAGQEQVPFQGTCCTMFLCSHQPNQQMYPNTTPRLCRPYMAERASRIPCKPS